MGKIDLGDSVGPWYIRQTDLLQRLQQASCQGFENPWLEDKIFEKVKMVQVFTGLRTALVRVLIYAT